MRESITEVADGIIGLLFFLAAVILQVVFSAVFHPIVAAWWARGCFEDRDPDWRKFFGLFLQGIVFLAGVVFMVVGLPGLGKLLALLPLIVYIGVGVDLFDAVDDKQQYGHIRT